MSVGRSVDSFFNDLEAAVQGAIESALNGGAVDTPARVVHEAYRYWWRNLGTPWWEHKRAPPERGLPKVQSPGWLLETLMAFAVVHTLDVSLGGWRCSCVERDEKSENSAIYYVWQEGERWVRATFGCNLPGIDGRWEPDIFIASGRGHPTKETGGCIAVAEIKSTSSIEADLGKFNGRVTEFIPREETPLKLFMSGFGTRPVEVPADVQLIILREDQAELGNWFLELASRTRALS